eukprot:TRINITY_DN38734_c0_g1_i1.p1 TRINITY_DN38734_c0_g1~~TRINITY_DN38734_c0_g1_i1.p1  ORF type:complete len:253 (-),score=23.75 TRINITY_DN38734_c0_g1_i1:195-953(-)
MASTCSGCRLAVLPENAEDHEDVCVGRHDRYPKVCFDEIVLPVSLALRRIGFPPDVVHTVLGFLCYIKDKFRNYIMVWPGHRISDPEFDHLENLEVHVWRFDFEQNSTMFNDCLQPCVGSVDQLNLRPKPADEDYEICCHGCGKTLLKSHVLSGAHRIECRVAACRVLPVPKRTKHRDLEKRFVTKDLWVRSQDVLYIDDGPWGHYQRKLEVGKDKPKSKATETSTSTQHKASWLTQVFEAVRGTPCLSRGP